MTSTWAWTAMGVGSSPGTSLTVVRSTCLPFLFSSSFIHPPTHPPTHLSSPLPNNTAEARANGSILPVKGPPQNNNVRFLQVADAPLAGTYLAPGKYLTKEGIVDMETVKAKAQAEVVATPSH